MNRVIERLMLKVPSGPLNVHEVGLMLEPEEAFGRICRRPGSFFLDSSMSTATQGRRSYIGCDPVAFIKADSEGTSLSIDRKETVIDVDPMELLKRILAAFECEQGLKSIHFCGGLVGYLSYEAGHYINNLRLTRYDEYRIPWMSFGLYPEVLAVDIDTGRWYLTGPGANPERSQLLRMVTKGRLSLPEPVYPRSPGDVLPITWNFTQDNYKDMAAAALHYIREGEIGQIKLSQKLKAPLLEHSWHIYSRLRVASPAPFSSYLHMPGVILCNTSMKRFLRVEAGRVKTCNIDTSGKRQAAGRNFLEIFQQDLSKVCRPNSVRTIRLDTGENNGQDYQVEGMLRPDSDVVDLLRAAFPSPTVIGYPKVSAMKLIDELEPTLRGPYGGSIGYFGFDGSADLSVALNTLVISGNHVHAQVGSSLTGDSTPSDEFDRIMRRAQSLIQTLKRIGR